MPRRQPLPRLWMMTDERQGNGLLPAVGRLPPGSGIIFRHYGLARKERRLLFERVRGVARKRRLLLILAGTPREARSWRADGSHGHGPAGGLRTASVHDLAEIRAAERAGASLVFLSPVFATRSHPGGRTLGTLRFGLLARQARLPVIALGGMDRSRARRLPAAYGWAAIDALTA